MNVIQRSAADGRPSFGVWAAAPSPASAEVLGRAGLDWVMLDQQHGAIHPGDLLNLIQAIELGGAQAIVRVPWNEPSVIMRALDLGAVGVVVPMVSTGDQARAAGAATRYPPDGQRSFGPLRNWYARDESSLPSCLVMIETTEALANLDEIASAPGVDGLFVGPMDLALAIGAGLHVQDERVSTAIDQVVAAAHRHGIIAGAASMGPDHAESLLTQGIDLLTLGTDLVHLRTGLARDRERAEQWTAQRGSATKEDDSP